MTLNYLEVKMPHQIKGKSTWKVLGCTCKYIKISIQVNVLQKLNVLKYFLVLSKMYLSTKYFGHNPVKVVS